MNLNLPNKFASMFSADGMVSRHRYKVFWGGRGSGKSQGFASIILACMRNPSMFNKKKESLSIICAREFGSSIDKSVSKLLRRCAREMGISREFVFNAEKITHRRTGSSIGFMGLARNILSAKSMDDIDILWIEEGESVSSYTFNIINPTIRANGSQVWITFNPDEEDGFIYDKFVVNETKNSLVVNLNYYDNPWFPTELEEQRAEMFRTDPDLADHIWNGKPRVNSHCQIFIKKWKVYDFDIDQQKWDGPYFGVDWGFSVDPTAIVEVWIFENVLYIDKAETWIGLELNDTAKAFAKAVPLCVKNIVRADCARPETISLVKKDIPRIVKCVKWGGFIEDGIAHLRSYDKIVIRPKLVEMISEAKNYKYKADSSGKPTSIIIDKHNHLWDAIRYALEPLIKTSRKKYFGSVNK